MAEPRFRLSAAAAAPVAGIDTRIRRLDGPGLALRGLYLLSAALTGALIYLGVHWPSAAQPRPVAATQAVQAAAAPVATALVPQHSASQGGLAAGALIIEGLRDVNGARDEILLAEQAAHQTAAARPAAPGVTISAPAPATQITSATQITNALPLAPAQPAVAPSPSPSMVAESPQTAPADVGTGPAQRSPLQVPNHITVPATVPPPATPTPARPR